MFFKFLTGPDEGGTIKLSQERELEGEAETIGMFIFYYETLLMFCFFVFHV